MPIAFHTSTKATSPQFVRDPKSGLLIIDHQKIAAYLNLPATEQFAVAQQTHSNNVLSIRSKTDLTVPPNHDALITNLPNLHLVVHTADCLPIFFHDPTQQVIGIAHSGWRGTADKIVLVVLKAMVTEFSCRPTDIKVNIGPSIGHCCYDTNDPERLEIFGHYNKALLNKNGKTYVDLWQAVQEDVLNFGILAENFSNDQICTQCHNNQYSSHRAEGQGRTTANISSIVITPN